MAFEKTWQYDWNHADGAHDTVAHLTAWFLWYWKALCCGQFGPLLDTTGAALTTMQGLWVPYSSSDGAGNFGNGNGIDWLGTQGSTTGLSGSTASLVAGASIPGAIKLSGVTGMDSTHLGKCLTITGAATAANNSPTQTPFVICKVIDATDVEIFNPNGVTGDANNGSISWVERGVYTFNSAKFVAAAGAVNHTWVWFKSGITIGGYYWYCGFELHYANTYQADIVFAKTAPTGGTATARPTSTDEWVYSALQININSAVAHHGHGLLATDGNWIIQGSRDTSGLISFGMIFQCLSNAKAADLYPAWTDVNYDAANGAFNSGVGITGNLITGGVCCTWNAGQVGPKARNSDGTAVIGIAVAAPSMTVGGTTLYACILPLFTSSDVVDGSWPEFPCWVVGLQYGTYAPAVCRTCKGRLVDMFLCPDALTDGVVQPATAPYTATVSGNLWLPTSNTIPSL